MPRLTYYKATTPNGTDFWGGTFDYAAALASGEVIRHPATLDPDDAATYLSVATAPTACAGMSWPCRLFVVEPVGHHQPCKRLPHKVICSALRVIEERPAHEALGPQGEEVAALIERAKRLTSEEIEGLVRDAAWDVAWDAAWATARHAARVAAWDAARVVAWDAAWAAAWAAAWDAAWAAAWDAAWAAAWAASLALLTRDLISEQHFEVLYGPWRDVIGTPPEGE